MAISVFSYHGARAAEVVGDFSTAVHPSTALPFNPISNLIWSQLLIRASLKRPSILWGVVVRGAHTLADLVVTKGSSRIFSRVSSIDYPSTGVVFVDPANVPICTRVFALNPTRLDGNASPHITAITRNRTGMHFALFGFLISYVGDVTKGTFVIDGKDPRSPHAVRVDLVHSKGSIPPFRAIIITSVTSPGKVFIVISGFDWSWFVTLNDLVRGYSGTL